MCRRIEEVEPTVGSHRHIHFVGFFNVPVQAPTRDPSFYGYSEKPPHFSRLLRHAWGYGGHILDLTLGSTRGMATLYYCLKQYLFRKVNMISCEQTFSVGSSNTIGNLI